MQGWADLRIPHLGCFFVVDTDVHARVQQHSEAFLHVVALPKRVEESEYDEAVQTRLDRLDCQVTGLHEPIEELGHVCPGVVHFASRLLHYARCRAVVQEDRLLH